MRADVKKNQCACREIDNASRGFSAMRRISGPVGGLEFIARNQKAEVVVRQFVADREILTLPAGLQHFTLRPEPPYLAALGDFVEMDDFTSPSRLNQNGIRYVVPPSPAAGYFWVADAGARRYRSTTREQ